MRSVVLTALVLGVVALAPAWATADSGAPPAADSQPQPPAGSAAQLPTPSPAPAPAPAPAPDALALRKTCADAMNANPTFAIDIVEQADKVAAERRLAAEAKQHEEAARHIATNEKHVILAYAAMWLVAAGFVLFLARRQIALRREIAILRRDLDAATKENP